MIIILEKFSLKIFFFVMKKILINKFKEKKIIKIFVIAPNYEIIKRKYILFNFLSKILIKNIKEFKWNLIDINDHKNSCIINSLLNSIYPDLLTKAVGCNNLLHKDNFYYLSLKYRLLDQYYWPNANNYIYRYMIIVFAINKNFKLYKENKIYLLLENFLFPEVFQEFAKKYNIQIEFIKKNTSIFNLHKFFYFLIKDVFFQCFKFYFFRGNLFFKDLSENKKIVLDLPSMNNPNHFIEDKKNLKEKLILVNRSVNLADYEKKQIQDSKIKFFSFHNNLSQTMHLYKLNPQKKYSSEKYFDKSVKEYFLYEKQIWKKFFIKNNVSVYYSNSIGFFHSHSACSAINDIEGVSVLSQTSYHDSRPLFDICSDIFFTFSADPENLIMNTSIETKYLIKAGYTQDYNFRIFENKSKEIRRDLKMNGVKKIIAFFDQGHASFGPHGPILSDSRYDYGYINSQKDYAFILNKLIDNKWLGLILKPKKPESLMLKLTGIEELFEKAHNTGRMYVNLTNSASNNRNNENPACIAAMASDLSIHSSPTLSATPGIESFLAKTPAIFLDKTNNHYSKIQNDYNKHNVFKDWNTLWSFVNKYFVDNMYKNELGNLNDIKNTIDPFNDGKANLRIINFLNDLSISKNLKQKEKKIEFAIKNYTKKWGDDKIVKA